MKVNPKGGEEKNEGVVKYGKNKTEGEGKRENKQMFRGWKRRNEGRR